MPKEKNLENIISDLDKEDGMIDHTVSIEDVDNDEDEEESGYYDDDDESIPFDKRWYGD